MANVIELAKSEEIKRFLKKAFQSGNINFLFGSGASFPAVKVAGNIEQEIDALIKAEDDAAIKKIFEFLSAIQSSANDLIDGATNANNEGVLDNYKRFLRSIERILIERKTNLLPKQANIFSSNYDLFFEKASEDFPILRLNDGFGRRPRLDGKFSFSAQNFFTSTFNSGNLYNYKVEMPSVNLIKIHGSLSWKRETTELTHLISKKEIPAPIPPATVPTKDKMEEFNKQFALVVPQQGKYRETLLDRTYYDLLRLYSNELDKENSLLICFGFSFVDEHILDITRRALKNPTLKIVISAFQAAEVPRFQSRFDGFNNVEIISPSGADKIDFTKFNELLESIFVMEAAAQ